MDLLLEKRLNCNTTGGSIEPPIIMCSTSLRRDVRADSKRLH